MLFLKLFIIFTKIGTFNFGGGYAMLSLIPNESVVYNQWRSRMGGDAGSYSRQLVYHVAAFRHHDSHQSLSDDSQGL